MIPALKSEFRKLLTLRSTYFIIAICMAMVAFFAGYIEGFKATPESLQKNAGLLASESTNAIVFAGFILAFAGLLLMGHEYRYNTIMYSLTSANRRIKVLIAKFVAVTVFVAAVSLLLMFFSPLCTILGAALHGHHIAPQVYDYSSLIWRCLFCGWGYSMYAFLLVVIMRNQIGAIVTFLAFPMIGENILGLLLKGNTKYLPFNAVQTIAAPMDLGNHASSGRAALTVSVYVAVGLVVGAILFVRRDAN
jgi:ABC-type transport system involved in multi-copper enzyme maturation permease subunit